MLREFFSFFVAVLAVSFINEDCRNNFVFNPVKLEQRLILGMKPNYKIGLGRADITGPAADVNMVSQFFIDF